MLEKEDFNQIKTILDSSLDEKFEPFKQQLADIALELKDIKSELTNLTNTETEDIGVAYTEIESLKKRVNELELKLDKIQASNG